ncbi:MAG: addiction module protein, partial [Deinococcales bacterium]|nr:addiction module protein [Chitinophagaceae bacterium]
ILIKLYIMPCNKEALLQLSTEEKISLVTELWDSIDEQKVDL